MERMKKSMLVALVVKLFCQIDTFFVGMYLNSATVKLLIC